MNRLTGIHAVREALEAKRPLDSVIVAKGRHGDRIEELVRLARQHGIPVRFEERIQLDRTADIWPDTGPFVRIGIQISRLL